VEPKYPICMNLTPRVWSALVYLRGLSEEVDLEALMAEARSRGWTDPGPDRKE